MRWSLPRVSASWVCRAWVCDWTNSIRGDFSRLSSNASMSLFIRPSLLLLLLCSCCCLLLLWVVIVIVNLFRMVVGGCWSKSKYILVVDAGRRENGGRARRRCQRKFSHGHFLYAGRGYSERNCRLIWLILLQV